MVCRREVYVMGNEGVQEKVETSVGSCKSNSMKNGRNTNRKERERGEAGSRVCGRRFASSRSMGRVWCQTRDSRPMVSFKRFFGGRVHVFDYGGVRL